jgi:hypothetical protein
VNAATPTSASFLIMAPIVPSHDLFDSSLPHLECEAEYTVLQDVHGVQYYMVCDGWNIDNNCERKFLL